MKETTTMPEKSSAHVPQTREESRAVEPPVDIFELNGGLAVVADMPGVSKEDLDIRVENDVLTISGKGAYKPKGDSVYREFELVRYFRQFQLSEQVDQDRIKAEIKYGVLTIHLPRAEKAKPKKIAVEVTG